ncbi:hypothetical protein CDD82_5497 [Ophiocordyceps australis]|uniref:RNA helicase n=1 Tax=Ophiocordyceps australis TaxID=1399860 RepID=A0A2C5XIA2_9HYPO|nr:hypothetical protein CDD82_5497 [Ophiocordyceps australis]
MADQPAKRRKKKQPENVIYINGKAISIETYLNGTPEEKRQREEEAKQAESKTSPLTTDGLLRRERQPARKRDIQSGNAAAHQTDRQARGIKRSLSTSNARGQEKKLNETRKELPIWQYRDEIQAALSKPGSSVVVLVGETGSGKSTQLPQFLYREPWCRQQDVDAGEERRVSVGGTIAITQPRRVAATTLAHRVSREAGTPLGNGKPHGLVGYSVRFDHQVPRGTRIKFMTEGTLLQELLHDANLRQYSAVIIDEIHERSLDVDLLVGFLKQIITGNLKGRGGVPLKVIIMSATADVDRICDFFSNKESSDKAVNGVQVLRIQGRQFPVQVIYEPQPVPDMEDALVNKILKIHLEEPLPGGILAFLIGQDQIESAQKRIEGQRDKLPPNAPKIVVCPLYGQLSMQGQRDAFMPVKTPFTRKIVLATNIAETSVTVPGVRYVVDCGKAKVKTYRPRLGLESLLVQIISKSSALQRTGRAGREGPGKCFRLYTDSTFDSFDEVNLPEILRIDIVGALLTMKARGIKDVINFPLMDKLGLDTLERAMDELRFVRALDEQGDILPQGLQMARLPVPVPHAGVLLTAALPEFDCVLEAIDIISCITSGEDIFLHLQSEEEEEEAGERRKEVQRREGDLITYLTTMQRYSSENADRTEWCRQRGINMRNMRQALNIRRQLRAMSVREKLLAETPPPDPQPFIPVEQQRVETILRCFLLNFGFKVALLMPDGSYKSPRGNHVVVIHPASVLHGQKKEAIMFLEHIFTTKSYVKKVSAIRSTWIVEALEERLRQRRGS